MDAMAHLLSWSLLGARKATYGYLPAIEVGYHDHS